MVCGTGILTYLTRYLIFNQITSNEMARYKIYVNYRLVMNDLPGSLGDA
jgi:hypothetical protein